MRRPLAGRVAHRWIPAAAAIGIWLAGTPAWPADAATAPPVRVEVKARPARGAARGGAPAPKDAGARPGDPTYNTLLRSAARQSSQGQHAAAMKTFEQLLALYPDDPTVARGYVDVLQALGRHEDAERFLREWLERRGPDASVLRSLAGVHRSLNRYDLYLEDVMEALRHPTAGDPLPLTWALRALEEIGEQPEMGPKIESAVRRLAREESRQPELRILLADQLLRAGNEAGALAEVVEADRLAGQPGQILFQYGEELQTSGRESLAEEAFRRAARSFPAADNKIMAWTRVAEMARDSRRPGAEAEAWQAIAGVAPKSPAGWHALESLAQVQLNGLQDHAGALATLQALEKNPELGDLKGNLYLPMAECLLRLDRLPEALTALEKLKGSKADQEQQAEGAFLVAEINFYRGAFDEAQTAYQTAAENFTRTRKTNDAVGRYLQIARAKDQKDMAALQKYALMERASRAADTTAALAAADTLIDRFSASDLAADGLVRKAEMTRPRPGRSEEAIALCERAVAEHPKSRAAPYALALVGDICLKDLVDRKRGLDAYERLLDQYPQSLLSAEVRRVVEKLRRNSES